MTSLPQDSIRLTLLTGFSLALALGACSSNGTSATGSGGSPGSGGVVESGGTMSAGGTVPTGGSQSTGNSGGTVASGGSIQTSGGATSAGGTTSAGGATRSGGSSATGGATAAGGTVATGGASGGTTATGGSTGGISARGGAAGSTATGGRTGGSTAAGGSTATGGVSAAGGNTGGARPTGGTTGAGGATASGGITTGDGGILAAESASFHCFNWADPGDNFQSGPLKPTGLSTSDSYDTVLAKANAILSGFQTVLGANSIRIPINEATIVTNPTWWAAYKGVIDAAISKNMNVMVAYWGQAGNNGGKPADTTVFYSMWKSVVDEYVTNDLVYFDIMNEPWALSPTAFITLAVQWLAQFPNVPHNRVVVAGNYNDNDVNQQGKDSRIADCLLSLHIYDSSGTTADTASAALKTHLGPYYSRTIVTEYVGNAGFMQGVTTQMKAYGMGSCYWAGLEGTGGIAKINGTGTNLTLTVNNASTLTLIQSGWSP
jgi:hypothetical protein